ncbi:MAG: TIGR01777 family oxidoreductase [Balneolales bacterium]|nr:TIGR01777 family oxidoreductase [Balneolales bacterium]
MQILLSGGSGFIGTYLTQRLVERGDRVVIITRDPSSKQPMQGVTYISWDADLNEAVCAADAVVNMAGKNLFESRWTDTVKKAIVSSRVETTKKLAKAIAKAEQKPDVFVTFSATGYYGSRGEEPLNESSGPGNDFLAEVCVKWEDAAREAVDACVRTVFPRVGIVKQKDDGALAKMLLPFKMFIGGPLGDGSQYYPWVHMDDVIGLILHAIDTPSVVGPINVAAPEHGTMKEFAKALGSVLGRPSLFPVPGFVLRIAVGEAAGAIVSSTRIVPAKAIQTGYRFRYTDTKAALRDILS